MNVAELNTKITYGYLWILLSKWLSRSVGLITTLCLVRVLSPEDFGIVALCSIILNFFVLLSDAGTYKYLIQVQKLTDTILNSAWSLNITLKFVCCTTLALLSYPISHFMHNPELFTILVIFCLIPIINSFRNIGMVLYEKALDFRPLTSLSVIVKIIVLPITLSIAFYARSYWALVWGLLISEVLTLIGSYLLHPFRPRWSNAGWRCQWYFSKWHLLSVTTGYIRSRIDAILLGQALSNEAVGLYRIGQEFAWLPFTELIAPATNAIYAGFSQIKDNSIAFNITIINYLSLTYMLVIPSAMAIFFHNGLFTELLLGDKWAKAAPVIGWLSLLMLSMPLNICLQSALTALGKIKYLAIIDLIMISAIVAVIIALSLFQDVTLIKYIEYRVLLVAMFMLLLGFLYYHCLGIGALQLLWTLLFPAIPAYIMIMATTRLANAISLSVPLEALVIFILGSMVYFFSLLVEITLTKNKFAENGFIMGALRKIQFTAQNE